jgi:hypothetical protein
MKLLTQIGSLVNEQPIYMQIGYLVDEQPIYMEEVVSSNLVAYLETALRLIAITILIKYFQYFPCLLWQIPGHYLILFGPCFASAWTLFGLRPFLISS